MLWSIAIILVVLWALGMVRSYTMGGVLHVLIAVAIVLMLVQVVNGQSRFDDNQYIEYINEWYEDVLAKFGKIEVIGSDQWDAINASAESAWNELAAVFNGLKN